MRGNILIYDLDKSLGGTISTIVRNSASLGYRDYDEDYPITREYDLVLTGCDYSCKLDRCARKFLFLSANENLPVLLIKPVKLKSELEAFDGFNLAVYKAIDKSPSAEMLQQKMKKSYSYSGSFWLRAHSRTLYKIAWAQNLIEASLGKAVYLSEIARQVQASTSWLSTRFHEYSGISMNKYIMRFKCCRALWELISSDKLLKTIALDQGYQATYFSSLFHSHFKISPSAVRKEYRATLATPIFCEPGQEKIKKRMKIEK